MFPLAHVKLGPLETGHFETFTVFYLRFVYLFCPQWGKDWGDLLSNENHRLNFYLQNLKTDTSRAS